MEVIYTLVVLLHLQSFTPAHTHTHIGLESFLGVYNLQILVRCYILFYYNIMDISSDTLQQKTVWQLFDTNL